jgi:hypothetical protein
MSPERSRGGRPTVNAPTAGERVAVSTPDPRRHLQAAGPPEPDTPLLTRRERRRRTRTRARKVHRVVRHLEPWSVLKLSLVFYLCLFVIVLVASVVLWSIGRSTGVVDSTEDFITELGFGNCEVRADLPRGTEFRLDDDCPEGSVLVGGFTFEDRTLLQVAAVTGLILVLVGAAANVVLTVLFNLMSTLTGGVRLTVLEEQPSAPPADARASPPQTPPDIVARSPGL